MSVVKTVVISIESFKSYQVIWQIKDNLNNIFKLSQMPEKPVKHTSEELQVKLRSLVHKDLLDVFDKQFKTFTKVQV